MFNVNRNFEMPNREIPENYYHYGVLPIIIMVDEEKYQNISNGFILCVNL